MAGAWTLLGHTWHYCNGTKVLHAAVALVSSALSANLVANGSPALPTEVR